MSAPRLSSRADAARGSWPLAGLTLSSAESALILCLFLLILISILSCLLPPCVCTRPPSSSPLAVLQPSHWPRPPTATNRLVFTQRHVLAAMTPPSSPVTLSSPSCSLADARSDWAIRLHSVPSFLPPCRTQSRALRRVLGRALSRASAPSHSLSTMSIPCKYSIVMQFTATLVLSSVRVLVHMHACAHLC
ncbi:hypothetical protein B0H21DRAFT_252842 [Amylocystis lapponica]|nr:hypothetical protein B0H21DRAFT_252842 [Amylocystis lapponica]